MRSRVLLANSAVVAIGSVAASWLVIDVLHLHFDGRFFPIGLGFALAFAGATLAVNWAVLRSVLEPLALLEQAAEAVSRGDYDARTRVDEETDPQIAHFVTTFNATLDQLAADRARVHDLAAQTLRAQEAERNRISRELHDDTAQMLFAQLMQLSAFREQATGATAAFAERLEAMTAEALESVRRVALELRPPALDDLGLYAALFDLVQRFADQRGLTVDYTWHGSHARLPATTELALYRVAQEALTNVARHAATTTSTLALVRKGDVVTMTVADRGAGFDPDAPTTPEGRLGLFGMEERMALIGGTWNVQSAPGRGTIVSARATIVVARSGDAT
jgi:two-component system sensor histidine kinase UhpB